MSSNMFLDMLNKVLESDDNEDEDYLTDEEKELVRSGDYEPSNFEYPEDEEELDEEDYYSEDF